MLRSERMLNIEKYKEELENIGVINPNGLAVIDGKPVECSEYHCDECDFGGKKGCEPYLEEWLFSEYKEPEIDWSKVKVDTPIMVKNTEDGEWTNRYFAKFEDGIVYTWGGGTTSWTARGESPWDCAKLAESEE